MALTVPDPNALSLLDHAAMSNLPLVPEIIFSLYENGSVVQDLPFLTNPSLVSRGYRWVGDLPPVTYAPLNQSPAVVRGRPQDYSEQLYNIRNQIQVDIKLKEDQNTVGDIAAQQLEAYLKSLTYRVNTDFILNDPLNPTVNNNVNAPVGLRARLSGAYPILDIPTEMLINAGPLDISMATVATTPQNANIFFENLDALLSNMNDPNGENTIIYVNDILKRRMAFLSKALGGAGFSIVKDNYDRTVEMYRGATIRDLGREVDQSTRIISQFETSAGLGPDQNAWVGGSYYTSLYAVRTGAEYFSGVQFAPPMTIMEGRLPGTYTDAITFDWSFGWWQPNNRSVGRIYGLNLGSTVA